MKQGITKCEWCLTESDNEHLQCPKCGGPVAVLEPWVLQCGWCSASNRRDLVTDCQKCGGELPHIPGTPRQPEPPQAPRKLSSRYIYKVKYFGNVLMIIGVIFLLVGIPVFLSFLIVVLRDFSLFFLPLFASIFPIIGV